MRAPYKHNHLICIIFIFFFLIKTTFEIEGQISLQTQNLEALKFLADFTNNYDSNIIQVDFSINSNRYAVFDRIEDIEKYDVKGNNDMCEERHQYKESNPLFFLPIIKAKPKSDGSFTKEWKNGCFSTNTARITKISKEETIIVINHFNPKGPFCSDSYIISTSNFCHFYTAFIRGSHQIKFKNLNDDDIDEIKAYGIQIFAFCEGAMKSIKEIWLSLKLFLGGLGSDPNSWLPWKSSHVAYWSEKENYDFLKNVAKIELKVRKNQHPIQLDKKMIHSGDFLPTLRLWGVGSIIILGTGGHISHSAVAAWEGEKLYVYESDISGIRKKEFDDWIQFAIENDLSVAHIPLSEDYRKKFNVEKALEFFKSVEGHPYGFKNFLTGWIDTPHKNLPSPILDEEMFQFLISLVDRYFKSTSDLIFIEGLNIRLGTKGLNFAQIIAETARRGTDFGNLIAMPELENTEYSNGVNYVCSAFVAAFWKAGGLFDNLEINPQEFTPKDLYQLNFFNPLPILPDECKNNDPDLLYCMIIGKYKIELPYFNTVIPYNRMNERCSSIGPNYVREPGC
jgi:hypothetical protein